MLYGIPVNRHGRTNIDVDSWRPWRVCDGAPIGGLAVILLI